MLSFTPYENPMYFGILGLALLPIVIGILCGKRFHWYETLISVFFLVLTFGGPKITQGLALITYLVYEVLLVWVYTSYRKKNNQTGIFVATVILAIIPLVIVKLTPAIQEGKQAIIGFLGISYLTFKAVQTIMESRDGVLKDFSPWFFLQFLVFFPTISSGPIDRYRRFKRDYDHVHMT